jgi:hypothetical protein
VVPFFLLSAFQISAFPCCPLTSNFHHLPPRQQLQMAYELAFHPARLNATWNEWEKGTIADVAGLRLVLEWALTLHQRLPEAPGASGRALRRLARYQANARLYRLPSMVRAFRARLGGAGAIPEEVPAWMVRDIGLPIFGRERKPSAAPSTSGSRL